MISLVRVILEVIIMNMKDDFGKIRYIYLQVCNTFSYDVRFMYANQDLKNEIYNKKIQPK